MGWRLIDTDLKDPYFVTAADEVLLLLRDQQLIPNTIHFYRRNQPTISIGRSRKIKVDTHLQFCKTHHIPIIRRTTGGGTIYTDPGCLIYTLVFNHDKLQSTMIFQQICQRIINCLKKYQINPTYKPPNDILVKGKKISGSAQRRKQNAILLHGTLLINTDLNMMNQALTHSPVKSITTLYQETTKEISIERLKQDLLSEFSQYLETSIEPASFTPNELEQIQELIEQRYTKKEWNHAR